MRFKMVLVLQKWFKTNRVLYFFLQFVNVMKSMPWQEWISLLSILKQFALTEKSMNPNSDNGI